MEYDNIAANPYIIIIILSSIVVISYFFTVISKKTNIPSVLLLIITGIILKYVALSYNFEYQNVQPLVKILGAVGLVMIILEAALDLDVNKSKLKLIRNSFFSALIIFFVSAASIAFLISYWLHESYEFAFIYAVPLSIISSAIVIPSTENLPEQKKEFIIYEASFSDILGILIFNFMVMNQTITTENTMVFTGKILAAIVASFVATVLLVYLLSKIEGLLKFFLIFAILSILYAGGELIHLPALIIILVFGTVLNNTPKIMRGRIRQIISVRNIIVTTKLMKSITAETSFLVRTFFFILFGYTINLNVLLEQDVVIIGSLIVMALLLIRFLYLRLIVHTNLFPELFLMPRGLVTILLFYSIPASKQLSQFKVGIIFYVVVITSLLMMVGLLFYRKDEKQNLLQTTEDARI